MRYLTDNKKMPRRLTAFLTAAVCLYTAAAFVGCGKKSEPAETGYGELETLPPETEAPPEPPPPPRELDPLEERLTEQLALYEGKWSIYVQDLSTGKEILMNDRKVYAASEIKLFAMAAAYQQVQDGKLALVSVEDDVEVMISESDNYRFNRIIEKIGLKEVNRWCEANGYDETEQHHGLAPASNYSDSLRNGKGSNKTSAKDLGKLLSSIYHKECVSAEYSEKMLQALMDQQKRDKIPAGLPKVVKVANKTGETEDENHDAAIVYSDGGDYILVITVVNPTFAWDMNDRLAEVSETVYDYFNDIPFPELPSDSSEEDDY